MMQAGAGRLKRVNIIEAIDYVGDAAAGGADTVTQHIILREVIVKADKQRLQMLQSLLVIIGGSDELGGVDVPLALAT